MNGTSVEVTGGLGAFLALFFLAVAVIFLGYDLSRRLRRLDQQERLRVEEERLTRERRGQATTGDARDSDITDDDGPAT